MTPHSDSQSLRRLVRLLRPQRRAVSAALASMALASVGLLGLPLLLRGLLEGASLHRAPGWWQVGSIALLLAVLALSACLSSILLHEVARKVCARLRSDYVARWLRSSIGAHRGLPTGEVAERLNTSLADIDWFIKGSIGNLLGLVLVMAGGGMMLFWLSWRLALVIVLVSPVVVLLLRLVEREGRRLLRLGRLASEKMAGTVQGLVLGLDTIKAFNAEEEALRRFESKQAELLKVQRKESFVSSLVEPLLIFAGAATFLIVVFLAGRLIAAGHMDLPEFITFLVYLMFVLPNLRNLGMQIARWRHVKTALDFLDDAEQLPAEHDRGTFRLVPRAGRIEFRDVSFHHAGRGNGLDGVSFIAAPGEHIAIVGESGAGKSTLLSLLLRFHEPQEGAIFHGDRDIAGCTLASVREVFAYVPQDVVLFEGTIAENLRLGCPAATDADLAVACRTAQIWDFIEALPGNLSTSVGDRGLRMSAGQRQRLAVARALLKKAPVVLLDEATSSLDARTEQSVGQSLRRALAGRTGLVVAHRLSTIAALPRVLFLHHGRIAGDGAHADLMEQSAEYRRVIGGVPDQDAR
jgi:ABC-type multidrug transport system fused ATPase/permease subunit